jgi:hypothetical protein
MGREKLLTFFRNTGFQPVVCVLAHFDASRISNRLSENYCEKFR